MKGTIARWTTPSILFKPSQAEIGDIKEIYVVLSQKGEVKISKGINEAGISEDGFLWSFSQEDTGPIIENTIIKVQIDYLTDAGQRYTTIPVMLESMRSALDEVIE